MRETNWKSRWLNRIWNHNQNETMTLIEIIAQATLSIDPTKAQGV